MVVVLGHMLGSCEKDLDLTGNWIKIVLFENESDYEGSVLKSDTLNRNIGDMVKLHISSQSQPSYKFYISLRINNEFSDDVIFFTDGPSLIGYDEENGVEREIYRLKIFLTHISLNKGDEIKVISVIKSASDVKVERELIIKIK